MHAGRAPHYVDAQIHQSCNDLTQSGQGRQKYQHDFPAALPLRRKRISVPAAF
jgi:hypothetical protein